MEHPLVYMGHVPLHHIPVQTQRSIQSTNRGKEGSECIRAVLYNFTPRKFTYAPVFSDDAPVYTVIINIEKLLQNVFNTKELLRAGVFIFVPGLI